MKRKLVGIRQRKYVNIRVSDDTYRRAVRVSKREQRGLGVVFERAVDAYDRASRLEQARKEEEAKS